ncbi:GGDEF domain-containing protein [Saccharospirillum salsuginis]|uniref:diguanylate cyclase n=2 Tax=Saccharospirillum salsuginis TaxID=418750 RepID=A0A918K1L5_9GAMM|nr:GGDEF domain-containing protein [Saccharospirillum salsuginis]
MGFVHRLWWRFVTVNGYLTEEDPEYRRLYLINVMLLFTLMVTVTFTQVHLFWTGITALMALNLIGFVATLSATVYLRVSHNLERVATFLNAIAFGGLATYLVFRQDSNQVYLWAAAYFPFAFFLKGRRVGGYFAGAFYVLVVAGATVNFTLIDPVPTTTLIRTLLNISTSLLAVCGMLYYYEATRADAIQRLSRASDELFTLSTTDALTGLYNRRYFDDVLPVMLARAQRDGELLCMLIIDADYFKAYNDYYGHPQGDQALKTIANVMTDALKRSSDLAFRLGGEEFGALYTVKEPDQAKTLAEHIRTDLERQAVPSPKSSLGKLTVSIGLRLFDGSVETSELSAWDLVSEADQALYRAKSQGRNRVVVYRPE